MIELVFKKYFWILTGLTTGTLAFLTAGAVNSWLGGKLRSLQTTPLQAPTELTSADPTAALRANTQGLAELLSLRRIFNTDEAPNSESAEPEESEGEELAEGEVSDDSPDVPLSDMDISLLGTLVYPDPEWSMATVRLSGSTKLVRTGTEVEDSATIKHIDRTYILLSRNDKTEMVRLWSEKPKKSGRSARPGSASSSKRKPYRSPAKASSSRPTPSKGKANYSKHVAKTGEWEYKIDKTMLDEQLNDLAALGSQARVVPNYVGGKYSGFKLVGVRPNSLYRAIGIRSGDVIKRINGMEIDSPNKALQLFEKLQNSRRISLDMQRGGVSRTLYYTIQ